MAEPNADGTFGTPRMDPVVRHLNALREALGEPPVEWEKEVRPGPGDYTYAGGTVLGLTNYPTRTSAPRPLDWRNAENSRLRRAARLKDWFRYGVLWNERQARLVRRLPQRTGRSAASGTIHLPRLTHPDQIHTDPV